MTTQPDTAASAVRNTFPGFPHLNRVAYDDRYGGIELIEVNRTSDGFLIGMALITPDDEASNLHHVFLGRAA